MFHSTLGLLWSSMLLGGLLCVPVIPAAALETEEVCPGLRVVRGPVNGAWFTRQGKILAVYGDPREQPVAAEMVLFTHHRREVVWAGRALVQAGAQAVAPAAERAWFADPRRFWSELGQKRFHDYAQQTTKVITQPLAVTRWVEDGDTWTWEGLPVRVVATPGYTRGAVSYLVEMDGLRIVFTGDLIYGDGQLLDLYSLQDALPEAKIGGYHGYAARLGPLLNSLEKVAALQPDLLIPARGPVIREPRRAMDTLTARVRALYRNYLSSDALRWYFGDAHILAKAGRVLGEGATVDWMPMAEVFPELPSWLVRLSNARLIIAKDRSGFLIDCGSQGIIEELKKLQAAGKLTTVEHVFITHYHDDHTEQVAPVVNLFGATVHATERNWEILQRPGDFRMPCLTTHPIHVSGRAVDGAPWRWKEFTLSLHYFPGQTLLHDALLVRPDQGVPYFFIGDSFTPSGVDDYCLLNRNWLAEDRGFLYCLDLLRRVAPEARLVNQHVEPAFHFTAAQLTRLTETLRQRRELARALMPWDDPNFGLDEGWARFHPYAVRVCAGATCELDLRIMNHAPVEKVYAARLHLPAGWALASLTPGLLRIPAGTEGALRVSLRVPSDPAPGPHIITADLRGPDLDLREWTEAMIEIDD